MTQPHQWIIEKAQAQMAADLLRAPPLAKQLGDQSAQPIIGVDPAAVLTRLAHGGLTMSIEGPIYLLIRPGVAHPGRHVLLDSVDPAWGPESGDPFRDRDALRTQIDGLSNLLVPLV